MKPRYWSFDGEDTNFHESEEEAEQAATNALEYLREQAADEDGWLEIVDNVCWGKVMGHVVEANDLGVPLTVEEEESSGEDVVDYVLIRVDEDDL